MPKAETITSPANPLLKDVRRAIDRGGLTAQGWCVAGTFHLLDEALRSDRAVHAVLAAESRLMEVESLVRRTAAPRILALPDVLLAKLSGTESSQGVIALVEPPVWTVDRLFEGTALVVILDGIQDPGNAGAIIRTAEAFGATGALLLRGSVSPFNPKTLRASAGSLFRLPFLHGIEPASALELCGGRSVPLYAAVPARRGAKPLFEIDLGAPSALVIGSEAHGVSAELRAASKDVTIPTTGVESLNAAVAAGILLYEARRQRTTSA